MKPLKNIVYQDTHDKVYCGMNKSVDFKFRCGLYDDLSEFLDDQMAEIIASSKEEFQDYKKV